MSVHAGTDVLMAYLQEALEIIALNAALYRAGHRACYRVVAGQLRLLLCDTTREHGKIVDISLTSRLKPDLSLHPFCQEDDRLSFNIFAPTLPRPAWLEQTLLLPSGRLLTLRDAIRLVCDRDGGAHVDPPVETPLPNLASPIIEIGEYIYQQFRIEFSSRPSQG